MAFNDEMDLQEGKQLKELHIFYLLDTSGSMEGEGIEQLNSGMRETIRILKDKFETSGDVHLRISAATFSNAAQWVTGTPDSKYSEYIEDFFDFPEQTAAGLTHLGDALNLLNKGLSRNEMLESPTGNKCPIIIIMTDGMPNDDWQSALRKIQEKKWFRAAIKIGIALGNHANEDVLAKVVGDHEAVIKITSTSQFANMLVAVSVTSSMVGSKSIVNDEPSSEARRIVNEVKESMEIPDPPAPVIPNPITLASAPIPTAPVSDPIFDLSDVE